MTDLLLYAICPLKSVLINNVLAECDQVLIERGGE